jgi:probable phosphoglycerate mutase
MLTGRRIGAVFTSPAIRAARTASLAGLLGCGADVKEDPDLWEWDYGGYEGMTSEQIQAGRPGWYLWRDGVVPGDDAHPGETIDAVGARADRVIARTAGFLASGDVALVAHGHVLRVLTARWLGLPPSDGRLFRLDTGTMSTLGAEHGEQVIVTWNVPPAR